MALSSTLEFERDERNTFKVESSNRKVNIKFIDISLSLKFLHIVNAYRYYINVFNFLRNITYLFIRPNVIFKHLQVKKFKITLSNYYQYFRK